MKPRYLLPLFCALLAAASPAFASMAPELNRSFVSVSTMYNAGDPALITDDDIVFASGLGPMDISGQATYPTTLAASATLEGEFSPGLATSTATLHATNLCPSQAGANSGKALATAVWDFVFTIDQAQTYSVTGTFGPDLVSSFVGLYGYDAAGGLFQVSYQTVNAASSTLPFNQTGALEPGRYWLWVNSHVNAYLPGNALDSGHDLAFAVTPEPASVTLALGGLALFFRRRR